MEIHANNHSIREPEAGTFGFEVSLAYIEKPYLNKIKQKREEEEKGKEAGRRREKKMELEERQTGRGGEGRRK